MLQQKLGGDALIGSKLHGLLAEAGFRDIDLSLGPELHRSGTPEFRVWIENQIAIFAGCAHDLTKHGVASGNDVDQAMAELRSFLQHPRAATLFAWNRAASAKT